MEIGPYQQSVLRSLGAGSFYAVLHPDWITTEEVITSGVSGDRMTAVEVNKVYDDINAVPADGNPIVIIGGVHYPVSIVAHYRANFLVVRTYIGQCSILSMRDISSDGVVYARSQVIIRGVVLELVANVWLRIMPGNSILDSIVIGTGNLGLTDTNYGSIHRSLIAKQSVIPNYDRIFSQAGRISRVTEPWRSPNPTYSPLPMTNGNMIDRDYPLSSYIDSSLGAFILPPEDAIIPSQGAFGYGIIKPFNDFYNFTGCSVVNGDLEVSSSYASVCFNVDMGLGILNVIYPLSLDDSIEAIRSGVDIDISVLDDGEEINVYPFLPYHHLGLRKIKGVRTFTVRLKRAAGRVFKSGICIGFKSETLSKTKITAIERITNKVTDCTRITIHGLDGDKVLQKTSGGAALLTAITQNPDGSLEATLSPSVSYVTDGAVEATAELTILRNGVTEQKTVRVEIQ